MAKYAISKQGVDAMHKLAKSLTDDVSALIDCTEAFHRGVRNREQALGSYSEKILELLDRQRSILYEGCGALEELVVSILETADKMEALCSAFTESRESRYTYEQDDAGRTVRAQGKLVLQSAIRDAKAQLLAGGKFRRPTDDGGHLIGNRFMGSGEKNLIAQNRRLNRSGYKALENEWERLLQNGSSVEVDIRPVYQEHTTRPHILMGEYDVTDRKGNETKNYFSFTNEDLESGEFRIPDDCDDV